MSRKLNIPKSSTNVIVITLKRLGYVEREQGGPHYSLGPAAGKVILTFGPAEIRDHTVTTSRQLLRISTPRRTSKIVDESNNLEAAVVTSITTPRRASRIVDDRETEC